MANSSRRPRPSAAYRRLEGLDTPEQKLIRYAKKFNEQKGYAAIVVTLGGDRIFVSCDHLGTASEVWHDHKDLRKRFMITYGHAYGENINYTPARIPWFMK